MPSRRWVLVLFHARESACTFGIPKSRNALCKGINEQGFFGPVCIEFPHPSPHRGLEQSFTCLPGWGTALLPKRGNNFGTDTVWVSNYMTPAKPVENGKIISTWHQITVLTDYFLGADRLFWQCRYKAPSILCMNDTWSSAFNAGKTQFFAEYLEHLFSSITTV